MNPFNRMDEFFEDLFDDGQHPLMQSDDNDELFSFNISFPDTPDHVNQKIKIVKGRLVVSVEFIFDDVELLEDDE